MLLDLHEACANLRGKTVDDRIEEFVHFFRGVWVSAIGGFPILVEDKNLTWCGGLASVGRVRKEIERGLGLSAVLTYMNRSKLSLEALGSLCLERGHDWGHRWMTLSLVFSGVPLAVELAFARDTRFQLSWPVSKNQSSDRIFMASGTVKDWVKFVANRNDKDFDKDTRAAMQSAYRLVKALMPSSDKEQHFLVDFSEHRRVLTGIQRHLEGAHVLEIGAGHGELTRLILEKPISRLTAFEIEPCLCKVSDPRLILIEEDFTTMPLTPGASDMSGYIKCVISNPPYSLLPQIQQFISLAGIQQAMLLVPATIMDEPGWKEYRVEAILPGSAFTPRSEGNHLIVTKGFE